MIDLTDLWEAAGRGGEGLEGPKERQRWTKAGMGKQREALQPTWQVEMKATQLHGGRTA